MDTLLIPHFQDQVTRTGYAAHMLTCIVAGFRDHIPDEVNQERAYTLQAYNKKFSAHDAVMSLYAKGQSITIDKLLDYASSQVLPKTTDMPQQIVRGMECLSEYLGYCKTILSQYDVAHLTEDQIAKTARQAIHLVEHSPYYSKTRSNELTWDL